MDSCAKIYLRQRSGERCSELDGHAEQFVDKSDPTNRIVTQSRPKL
jgi:hypothetical protein